MGSGVSAGKHKNKNQTQDLEFKIVKISKSSRQKSAPLLPIKPVPVLSYQKVFQRVTESKPDTQDLDIPSDSRPDSKHRSDSWFCDLPCLTVKQDLEAQPEVKPLDAGKPKPPRINGFFCNRDPSRAVVIPVRTPVEDKMLRKSCSLPIL